MTIPGEDLELPEAILLQNIGKYLMLFEHEQKKRIVLVQAYNDLKTELDSIKNPPLTENDVIQGMP